ncbi:T9SS type B sorting domain-containing protein, partial [Terrimonas alba]|uniref:T9SS type B sorting domain-containing protein n=1 Tax=Terrimonas alba TaxID=3349636 RepID=UPI0035F43654
EAALPYSWNGLSVTTAGDHIATLTSTAGCDSVVTLHLIVNPAVTGEETITICEAALPYSWNGLSITSAGDHIATLTSVAGCDSVVTLHLIVNPAVTGEETITICEAALPYTWNGQSITTAGEHTATLTSVADCDSIATLHLIVNPVVTGEETITICEAALPYTWNGQSITTAGEHTATLVAASSCDSVVTLHLIVNPAVTGEETVTICEAALPYSWNGLSVTTAGDHIATLTSVAGCDSVVTLHLIVNPAVTGEETITICEAALSYSWNGLSVTTAGDHIATLTSVAGCDSVVTLHLIVNPAVTGEETITICEAALPYSWNGLSITTAGEHTATLTSVAGCDSVVTLHLIVNPAVTGEETITICEAALPYSWNGQSITTAGEHTATLTSTAGCDSVVTLHLIVNPAVTGEETITICEATLPYSWNGLSITTAGDHIATLTSTAGCDSVVTLHLIVNPAVTGEETITICEAALPYTWNGQSITAAGDYNATLVAASGCDSVATLHLIVNPAVTGEETITICEAALPYTWNGLSITTAGNHTATLVAANGCDSVATLHLNVTPQPPAPTVTTTPPVCNSINGTITVTLPAPGNGITYSINGVDFQSSNVFTALAPGNYTVTVNVNGCISTANVTLEKVTNTFTISQLVTNAVCLAHNGTIDINASGSTAPYTYSWIGPGNFSSTNEDLSGLAPGDYTVTVTDANGCTQSRTMTVGQVSSIITLNQQVTNTTCTASNGAIDLTVNGGTAPYSYAWTGPNGFSSAKEDLNGLAAGDYTVIVTDANGCTATTTATISQESNILTVNKTVNSATCTAKNGAVNLLVNGGNSPYTYNWKGPQGFAAATKDISNLASGTYEVNVTDANGCTATTTATVGQAEQAPKVVTSDITLCSPANLTDPSVTAGSDAGLTFTYWLDEAATNAIPDPKAVYAGTYYIKSVNQFGCATIEPVTVSIQSSPSFVVTNPANVCAPATVDITAPAITAGSDPRLTFTYWMDAALTTPISNPKVIANSGTYYIKASASGGCTFVKTVQVTITVNKGGKSVRYPTVTTSPYVSTPLTARTIGANDKYTWNPPTGLSATNIKNPTFRHSANTEYTITIDDGSACPVVDTLAVVMRQLDPGCTSDIFVPKAWSPNNDRHNDRLFPIPVCIRELKYFRVFNRWGQLVFETNILKEGWDGNFKGVPQVMDTYTWTLEATGEDGKYFKRAGNSVLIR